MADEDTIDALRERARETIVGRDMGLGRLAAQYRDGSYGDLQLMTVFKILLYNDFHDFFTFGLGWIRLGAVDWRTALRHAHNIQEFRNNIRESEVERVAQLRERNPRRQVDENWGYLQAADQSRSSHILLLNTGGHATQERGHFQVVTFDGEFGRLIPTRMDGNCFYDSLRVIYELIARMFGREVTTTAEEMRERILEIAFDLLTPEEQAELERQRGRRSIRSRVAKRPMEGMGAPSRAEMRPAADVRPAPKLRLVVAPRTVSADRPAAPPRLVVPPKPVSADRPAAPRLVVRPKHVPTVPTVRPATGPVPTVRPAALKPLNIPVQPVVFDTASDTSSRPQSAHSARSTTTRHQPRLHLRRPRPGLTEPKTLLQFFARRLFE